MKLSELRKFLLLAFVFLGPLGNLLTPSFFPSAFRAHYFILLAFPLFFTTFRQKQLKLIAFSAPFFLYCFLSSLHVELFGSPNEPHSLFRFFLFYFHFLFVLGSASVLVNDEDQLLILYLKSFFISLIIGYIFFIGYYLNLIPLQLLTRFSILTQFGYGLLRFSPGTYPNEYGILSSFALSLLTYFIIQKKSPFSKRFTLIFFVLTFIALMLTTTRAAYLAYLFSLFYLGVITGKVVRPMLFISTIVFSIFALLKIWQIDMWQVLSVAFDFDTLTQGSTEERITSWSATWESFKASPWLGLGFTSLSDLHNVYLELLFELGILGVAIGFVTLISCLLENGRLFLKRNPIRMMGAIHVLWFAMSNHNFNHHLTWFVLFLFLVEMFKTEKIFHSANSADT